MKRRHYFIWGSFLATIFINLMNSQVSALVKLVKSRQDHSVNNRFHENISQYNSFEISNVYQSKPAEMRYDKWNPNTGGFRCGSRTTATYKMELCNNSNIFQPLFFVTKSSILNAAGS